jgi:hypothetical protein
MVGTEDHGGLRRARGSRSADGGTLSPWSSVVLRSSVLKASFVARGQDIAMFPPAADPAHIQISILPVPYASFSSMRLRRILRPRSTMSSIWAASPQRIARDIARVATVGHTEKEARLNADPGRRTQRRGCAWCRYGASQQRSHYQTREAVPARPPLAHPCVSRASACMCVGAKPGIM